MRMTLSRSHSSLTAFDLVQHDDVAGLVAQLDRQPYVINVRDEAAQTLLIAAANCGSVKVLDELLKRNALDLNDTDQDETTALIAAAKENHQECATRLFNGGAELALKDKDGWGAITWAAYRGHANIVTLLLAWGANANEIGQHGMNPLIWAAGRGHTSVVEELLNAGANPDSCDKYGTSALVWASRKGHVDVMQVLLDKRANVNQAGTNGWTPLIMAAKGGFEQAVSILLKNGADVNFLDQHNNSALVWAVKHGHTGIVRKLADHGAFINIRNKEGIPVLTLAAKDGHVEIVRILLEHFADVEAVDPVGKTALWFTVEKDYAAILKELLEFGAFTECRRKDGETPLLLAVKKKHTEVTSLLLEKNADLSATNKNGDTALHIAVRCRYRQIAEIILKDPKSARLLYQPNRAGETPYHIDHRFKKSVLKPILGMAEGDRRHTEELLGHDVYTTSLAELLCEPSLEVPLNVGVYARWGSSKIHFFKRLQQEMTEITQQTIRPKLRFTWFGVLSCLFFCTLLGVCFCAIFDWVVGVSVSGTMFVLCNFTYCVILLWENKWCDNRDTSWVSQYFSRFSSYFHLLYLITFCVPPTMTSMRSSLPVHFTFADFSKLTRSSNEATALVSMIESLNEAIESNFGCVAARLYRVLRPPQVDYTGIKHSQPQFKKCCCCLPKLFIFFFIVTCGAVALVLYTEVGSDGGSVAAGLQISGACIVGIALVVHSTTFCSVVYSLLFSPKRRVSIVATQLGLKEEGFIHALKQEVELLSEVVIAMDGFKKVQTRIILFLDGLDNSEQQKVLHLVDSINLLFTDPDAPFISIIAIDPRVTVRAIEQNFSKVLQDSHITALDYLKSIIHLPFFLPEPKTNCFVNLPDCLRFSVETLLRQRKTSGFELEWEGEILELSPDSGDKWTSINGTVANNRHSTVLSVDHVKSGGEGKFRLNRSYMDIHCDRHEESPDLTHVLANNETLTPLGIQRLLHTTSLSGRLLRAKGFNFQWNALASWVSLVDSWPYRVSWLMLIMEEFTSILPDNLTLKALYAATQTWLPNSSGFDYAVDNDPIYFETYLGSHSPVLKVEDLRKFLVGTVNLDPALRNQICQGLQTCSAKTLNKMDGGGEGHGLGQFESCDLANLSEEDISLKLSQIEGIQLMSLPSYQTTIRENHISGRVLCECDISELRDVMEMNFGDWQLFRAWIMRQRPRHLFSKSHCNSPWIDSQGDRTKADSSDTYVEMGNLSCAQSASGRSRRDVEQEYGREHRHGPVNMSSIPKIVLDPGTSLNSLNGDQEQSGANNDNVPDVGGSIPDPGSNISHTRGTPDAGSNMPHAGENKPDAGGNMPDASENAKEDSNVWGKKIEGITLNEVRDLYSITPCTSFSSDDDSSVTESTPLVSSEPPEPKPKGKTRNTKTLSGERRPLLSKQPEIEDCADSVKVTTLYSLRDTEDGCASHSESDSKSDNAPHLKTEDEDIESQRVTPILFTVSPARKGNNHVVSSVSATRDLPLSRPSSLPNSPRKPKSPKSPRSPKSPSSLRAIFSCRGTLPKDDSGDLVEGKLAVKDSSKVPTGDISSFSFVTGNGHCSTRNTQTITNDQFDIGGERNQSAKMENDDKDCPSGETSSKKHPPDLCTDKNFCAHSSDLRTRSWPHLANTSDSGLHNKKDLCENVSKNCDSCDSSSRNSLTHHPACQEDPVVNGGSKNSSFEETTTNSDKGYESIDNSPSCVENDDNNCQSLTINGSVTSSGLSETTNPIWLPLTESQTFPRGNKPVVKSSQRSTFFSQTMV